MSDYKRKSTGMTLLAHLARNAGRVNNKNPNGIVGIKVGDVTEIVYQFKQMKRQRDEAMRLLGLRTLPNHEVLLPHGKTR